MAKKGTKRGKPDDGEATTHPAPPARAGKPSALLDPRVIYCGDNLQLAKLPDKCVDLMSGAAPAVQRQPQRRGVPGRDDAATTERTRT